MAFGVLIHNVDLIVSRYSEGFDATVLFFCFCVVVGLRLFIVFLVFRRKGAFVFSEWKLKGFAWLIVAVKGIFV